MDDELRCVAHFCHVVYVCPRVIAEKEIVALLLKSKLVAIVVFYNASAKYRRITTAES
jgi:hypothetical protein